MREATYVPGEWCLIVAEGGFAALQGDLPADLVTRIWERLGRGNGLSPVLEALTGAFGTSLAAIPPFAVALTEGTSLRLAVRGDITAHVTGASIADTVSGAGVTTWSERVLPDARSIDLVLPGPSTTDASYPVADGVVFASRLRVDLDPAASSAASAGSAAASAGSATVAEPVEAPPAAATPAAARAATPAPAAGLSPAALSPAAEPEDASKPSEPPTVASSIPVIAPQTVPPLAPPPPALELRGAPETSEPATEIIDSIDVQAAADGETLLPVESTIGPSSGPISEYDHLWGATIARPIEEAAVRPPESETPLHTEAPAAAQAPSAQAPAGDHDGETISVAQARAMRAATSDPPAAEPPVTALLKTPQLGRIHLSTGEVVALDRTVVIGRRPRSTRVSGTELPHLIAVDSPQQDISRSHVEIRPEADSVIVVDLHTTNGTTLLRAGKEPVRLHPGEQTVVVSGDVIDLGDGITVTFEDLP
ncbi:MAG TPA: FHA domain-containing protein [Microbacterium sp.]|nr:FHA domain-containing protein [Microbacterium sp.]